MFCVFSAQTVIADEPTEFTSEQIEFFESRVRPLLVEHCFECHSSSAKKVQGGLKLDTREGAIAGGDSGTGIVPGASDKSLVIDAIRWKQLEMPPKGKLPADQIDVLAKWVDLGAPWPANGSTSEGQIARLYDWQQLQSEHWAWKPVRRPDVPATESTWPINVIDRFVESQRKAAGLSPAAPADSQTLVRRIYFDLLGLPPEPKQVDEFVAQSHRNRATAISELVDRLLSSPQYGERWGRHWLDVARYSDGFGGFLDGEGRPNAWRYRDWVVDALNRDLPIDRFLWLQVAGDLADPPEPTPTGFFALGPTYISDGGDPDATAQAMSETLDDRVDTLSRGLLGLTAACARCHDHKFDPIPQLDYYSLAGIFRNSTLRETPLVPADVVATSQQHAQAIRDLEQKLAKRTEAIRNEKREPTDDEKRQTEQESADLERLRKSAPPPIPTAHALGDTGSADMPLAIRGNLRKPGPIAPRRLLRILGGESTPVYREGSGRRALADALVDRNNPLTPRVFVNRIWRQHFGQGLVRTPSNFGIMGERPSHPELLDWLTSEFMDSGWSLKKLHRLILTSATYQMASTPDARGHDVDGDNVLMWRMTPRRLDVEAWRDGLLAVTGELDLTAGGAPIEHLLDSSRRTLYGAVSRNGDRFSSETFLRLFDFPLPRATNEGRITSVVPQQALFLINSPFMVARAKALSARLQREVPDEQTRIDRAYQLLYGRAPTPEELALSKQFLADPESNPGTSLSRWEQYSQVLLSANEFMFLR